MLNIDLLHITHNINKKYEVKQLDIFPTATYFMFYLKHVLPKTVYPFDLMTVVVLGAVIGFESIYILDKSEQFKGYSMPSYFK